MKMRENKMLIVVLLFLAASFVYIVTTTSNNHLILHSDVVKFNKLVNMSRQNVKQDALNETTLQMLLNRLLTSSSSSSSTTTARSTITITNAVTDFPFIKT